MLFDPSCRHGLGGLEAEICLAQAITPELLSLVMAKSSVRLTSLGRVAQSKFDRLIAAGAWVDAALALIAFELPHWKLRRIVCDDGEWLCSLAKEPLLPLE